MSEQTIEKHDEVMQVNAEQLAQEVIGHRIVSVQEVTKTARWSEEHYLEIHLDNGKVVFLEDSHDCCAYTEVNKFLLNAANIDHIITGVSTENDYQTWHIYASMGDVLTLDVGYDPSNGYYGYGFEITVRGEQK